MSREPDYYAILGVDPTADDEAITAAYNGRSLRYRVGQLRNRAEDSSVSSQEALEQAYSILGNPQSRAMYDRIQYPDKPPPTKNRRRVPAWLWAFAAAWIVAIVVVGCVGIRSRITPDRGAIGQIVQTVTVAAVAGNVGGSATVPPASLRPSTGGGATSTTVAALPPTVVTTAASASVASVPASGTVASSASAAAVTRTAVPTQGTVATAVSTPAPTIPPTIPATATVVPPPTATAIPPTSTPTSPPVAIEPTLEPTEAPPAFQPTDRIGTALSVNLRTGPGAGYGSLGLLPTGTQLAATGETAYSGGQLWRRFTLHDGRVGWIRDLDVFPAR